MYRLMQPSDEAAVVALWQKERGDSAEFIKTALEKFAGAENIYVAEENDEIVAAALAVPVTLKGRSGSYLYGLCSPWPFRPDRSRPHCWKTRVSSGLLPSAVCPGRCPATCGVRRSSTP